MAKSNNNTDSSRGFEATLWATADKLRGTLDAAEYKHVVLGLIFLKYISDSFEERRAELEKLSRDKNSDLYVKDHAQREHLLEDKDEYAAVNVFWVPPKARWSELQNNAKQPHVAQVIDSAIDAIERANPRLRSKLSADYARRNVAAEKLGELIDLIASIPLGDKKSKGKDVLGRVYEYFLGKFAAAEGKLGGEFFTATCVVRLLVRMLEPYKGRVFDPCCGSAGMFVQSEKFVDAIHTNFAFEVQLKATSKIPAVEAERFSYWLEDVGRYDELRERSAPMPKLLVVLFLPGDAAQWLEHSEESLVARRCAYWASLWDAPATANRAGQTVYLPRVNVLSVAGLRILARSLAREEDLRHGR